MFFFCGGRRVGFFGGFGGGGGGEYFPALDCLALRSFGPPVTTCTVT